MLLFAEILLLVLAMFFFLIAFKFRQGKWIRVIAGNRFNKYPEEAKNIAPYLGIIMYLISIFILITVILTWYFS